jgi:uncharacterized protein (TIGR02001 family)
MYGTVAQAGEPEALGPATVSASRFDLAFGVAVTSDYVSRGITNSDSKPAVQGYLEPSFGMLYANVWSSNVDYGVGYSGAEIDLALGIRPQLGPVAFDLGYVHYFFAPNSVSPDYGEIFGRAEYSFQDMVTLGGAVYFAPDYSQSGSTGTYVEGQVSIPLPNDFSFSGALGYQFFGSAQAFEQLTWNAGLSYSWKALTLDLRYSDTNLSGEECIVRSGFSDGCDARIFGSLSFDTTWSDLARPDR